jgi:small acid-soluble spore protein B (major beta-type SASP)
MVYSIVVQFHIRPKKHQEECYIMARSNNSNQLLVPGVEQALDQMKYEIANEFGVNLGADTTSRANGSVGGEITKRLVQMAEQQLGGFQR